MEAGPTAGLVEEALALVREAEVRRLPLRLLGGIAVLVSCRAAMQRPELARQIQDIDCVAPRRTAGAIRRLFTERAYTPDTHFNAIHGGSRLLFYNKSRTFQVDVFLGHFEMCHRLDLEQRLLMSGPALSPSDLLLLKLQIVQMNPKDVTDALAIFVDHELVTDDRADSLSSAYIACLCAHDWGWFTTVHDNLEALRVRAREVMRSTDHVENAERRIDSLLRAMRAEPKTLRWRLRDRVGRRMVWYELPEEVN